MSAESLEPVNAAFASRLVDGLEYLNRRVPHRFTAIYRLNDGVMQNVAIFDKDGKVVPEGLLAVPLGDSFCQFAMADGSFLMAGASADERLAGHAYRGVVESYVGLPLSRSGGDLFGTLCHFDFPSREMHATEFAYLERVARMLPRFLD